MADGSPKFRAGPKQMNEITFSVPDTGHGDTKKCCGDAVGGARVKLSLCTELVSSVSCEKSGLRSVVAADEPAAVSGDFRKCPGEKVEDAEDRKKRCFDRYDSSESSDSGVAVLSPPESSGSDITEPRSPRSPESGFEEGASGRMPPWAGEGEGTTRRLAAQPAPLRRPHAKPAHRRITEFFNHKMKPQPALKREATSLTNGDTKRKCLPKNGVTHELEKYISYLSQTLNPKVLYDVGKKTDVAQKTNSVPNGMTDNTKLAGLNIITQNSHADNMFDFSWPKDNKEKTQTALNGFVEVRPGTESLTKEKSLKGLNGVSNRKNQSSPQKANKRKVPIPASTELNGFRIAPSSQAPKKLTPPKPDSAKMNGVVSSTTKLDSRMNGVTCGSNNLSLNSTSRKVETKKDIPKKQPAKRTNRKSSACIANSKNITWSKANNLKQQNQLQKQNSCNTNNSINSPVKTHSGDANATPKMTFTNGVRQMPMTVNGSLGNLSVPGSNFQNCHPLNISQPCNGTVTSTHLPSFVAVPQNMMLTTLRIPQNGIPAQTLNHQNNMNTFNGSNVNVSSPTKLNGQFVFPLVQNLNGAVVQIPNLMAKMPNFVLPQATQLTTHRQDHLQNQQAAQFLLNGTLLKLANTMTSTYQMPNINKTVPATSQSIPVMNKNVTGMPNVGMPVQPKPNFAVNLSHSVLMPQPGFIVTSVPNMNVKETWSYTTTHPVPLPTSCLNPIGHHPPPLVTNFTTPTLHSSSIPIAPVKPPDNPIQGTDPPSSTVKEPEVDEAKSGAKCDIPWLSKTVNNNILSFDSKLPFRPFAHIGLSDKLDLTEDESEFNKKDEQRKHNTNEDIRKIEEVARREETLFTQITMLKDVSSDVQNSIIDSNCGSPPTESSESGIGTDKSIDSPSDSHTSKECDEDSSLSVSVCSSFEAPCQKSPILKQPKTLRFPPKQQTKSDKRKSGSSSTSSVTVCQWENCKSVFESDTDLLEHLQRTHVETQAGKENYVCLWSQCKVRGKPSCSRLWLERHALSHGGNKPFKCIVDGCDKRFSTQILLERHVNNHFNETSSSSNGAKKSVDSAAKLIRRNGKKLRYRRQPWSARMFDFFDAGTMEGLCYRLARASRWRLGGACPLREPAGRHTFTLHAALTATRYNDQTHTTEALLTYYPPNVIEDEWVAEKDVKTVKRVEISELPTASKVALYEQFCASYRKSAPEKKPEKTTPPAPRVLPNRHCTSSRLLNNLLSKRREARNDCSATNVPIIYKEEEKEKMEVSGAKKRKMGRRHGGNCFWPCGR